MIKKIPRGKQLGRIFLAILIALICVVTFFWWMHSRLYISTDNAYVNANVVPISSEVKGRVIQLDVTNNQWVREGEVLFSIDPSLYQAAVDDALATLARATAETRIAKITADRTAELVRKHAASTQEGDIMQARLASAEATQAMAEAALTTARLHLSHTRVTAPASGWVTHLTLRVGEVVSALRPLFVIISREEFWVDANFRETELQAIRRGELAEIRVDMYPGHVFHGRVESISRGSGAAFSLLPPENATGNWVKVTQRVPVRVRVIDPDARFPLRIGASAKVTLSLASRADE